MADTKHDGPHEIGELGESEKERRLQQLEGCCQGEHHLEIKPTLFPLADGIPGRVGLLKGAGNAIVPQVAAEFIRATKAILMR